MQNRINNLGEYVIDRSVEIRNGQYGKWNYQKDKEPRFVPMGTAVYLEKILINADTSERALMLKFADAKGEECTVTIERKKLTDVGIMELLANGVQVSKKSAGTLITSLMNQEPTAPCEIKHTELGFRNFKGKRVFFGAIGFGIESQYKGSMLIKPTGNFEIWKSMIRTEAIGTNLETILAIACSAPIVDFLRDEIHIGNVIACLVAESSTGKTTAGCLGVSVGSKCSFAGDSMIATFADSKNSLMRSIYSSYPMLIDEGSLIRYNPTSLIYELAEGKEKGRLSKTLEKADSRTFSTSIFMTSEKSILNLCDENTGLYVRCLEFENITWTRSAKSADIIKNICENNYGFVIPRIGQKLLETNMEELLKQYWEYQNEIVERTREKGKNTPLTERLAKSIAVIMLAADFFYQVTEIQLNKNQIVKFIEQNTAISDVQALDIGNRALEYLRQYISIHYAQFIKGKPDTNELTDVPLNCKGRIQPIHTKILANKKKAVQEVFLPEIVFEEILLEGGFPDKKVILKRLKEEGYLNAEKDRFLSRFIVAKKPAVKGYRIYLTVEKNDENSQSEFQSVDVIKAKEIECLFEGGRIK